MLNGTQERKEQTRKLLWGGKREHVPNHRSKTLAVLQCGPAGQAVHWFYNPASTKYHQLSPKNYTNLSSYSLLVQRSQDSNMKKSQGVLFWRLQRRNFPSFFRLLEAAHIFWLVAAFFYLQSQQFQNPIAFGITIKTLFRISAAHLKVSEP